MNTHYEVNLEQEMGAILMRIYMLEVQSILIAKNLLFSFGVLHLLYLTFCLYYKLYHRHLAHIFIHI